MTAIPVMPERQVRAVARIAKVNHAGEYGAIRIYGAQILVSRLLWPKLVPLLTELHSHEIAHCRVFREAMPERRARPCRIMPLWSAGGWVLGFVTALTGPKMIWACTEAVEATVHRHLNDQIAYLEDRDEPLRRSILAIRDEEEGHLSLAKSHIGVPNRLTALLERVIERCVEGAIWMSTWGDSSRMRHDLSAFGEGGKP